MRIAVLPLFTINNVSGASELLHISPDYFKNVIGNVWFYYVVPRRIEDKLPKLYNTTYVFTDESKHSYYDQVADAPATFLELFNERMGRYPIDVVWTNRTAIAGFINRMLLDYRTGSPSIPVFIEEFGAIDYGNVMYAVREIELIQRSASYVGAKTIFNTDVERGIALHAARRYMTGSSVQKIIDNSTVIPHNVDMDKIRKARNVPKHRRFTLFFGARLNSAKRADKILENYDKFFRFGRDVDVLITSPRAESTWQKGDKMTKYPEVKFKFGIGSEEFTRECASSHVVLSASINEGFTVGVLEMMLLGPVVLLPNLPWVKGLLKDKFDEYPFRYDNFSDAQGLLKYVYDNYEDAQTKMEPYRKWIEDQYGLGTGPDFGKARLDFMLKGIEEKSRYLKRFLNNEANDGLLRRTLGTMGRLDDFTLDDFYGMMIETSDTYEHRGTPSRGKLSRFFVYKWLCLNGFEDVCDGPIPKFRRLKDGN